MDLHSWLGALKWSNSSDDTRSGVTSLNKTYGVHDVPGLPKGGKRWAWIISLMAVFRAIVFNT